MGKDKREDEEREIMVDGEETVTEHILKAYRNKTTFFIVTENFQVSRLAIFPAVLMCNSYNKSRH